MEPQRNWQECDDSHGVCTDKQKHYLWTSAQMAHSRQRPIQQIWIKLVCCLILHQLKKLGTPDLNHYISTCSQDLFIVKYDLNDAETTTKLNLDVTIFKQI